MTKAFATSILQDKKYLESKLAQYGDIVRAKWKKLSRDKRECLLLESQPTMYLHKYPVPRIANNMDAEIRQGEKLRLTSGLQQLKATLVTQKRIKDGIMLPYLNVEELREDPMKLLNLLYHRSTSSPGEWVMLDVAQMKGAFETGNLCREYNENCIIMFGERYGELIAYNREQCHRWDCIGFPRANLVLEAQAVLMHFLRNITDLIITASSARSQSASATGDVAWASMVSNGLKASGEVECWSTFVNQPFSLPQVLDAGSCLNSARAHLAAAEDHFRFLQTEPTYIHDLIAQQLRGEHMSLMPVDTKWEMIVADLMVYPIKHVRQLSDLVSECEHALKVFECYQFQAQPGSAMPTECERASGALEFLTINLYHHERIQLEQLLRQSPGFHRNFRYVNADGGKYGSLLRNISNGKESVNTTYFRDEPLLWALMNLTKNPEDDDAIDVPFLFGFVDDYLARSSAKERSRIDPTLYDLLGRMALYMEVVVRRRTWRLWRSTPGNLTGAESNKLITLLKTFYEQPLAKGKRDQAWLDAATVSRKYLSSFWEEAASVRKREVTGVGFSAEDIEEDVQRLRAEASSDHLTELRVEKDLITALIATEKAKRADTQANGANQLVWGPAAASMAELAKGHSKIKTRPDKASDAANPTTIVDRGRF
ncbi:hypothetical protein LTR37_018163 [Vermiconidia calcicola]|uniref:Uncharacterized protein n=1 Tax=Vermiconidia calcicola TaxID=1690605 RepID=A0ACC3MHT9_9PEZI|nr:hypothetical protein LTR37_018163 [Vermiconidia calcicola]